MRRSALIVAVLSAFLTPFLASAVNVALPAIGAALHMDAVQLSWVPTALLVTSAVCMVPFGRVADIVGRRRIFLAGMAITAAAALGCAVAPNAASLLAFRALQGVGSAMVFGTSFAILSAVFPASERGRVIGITVSVVYIGLSVGPLIGGLLTRHWGWRSVFVAALPLGVLGFVVAWRGLRREWTSDSGARFDLVGSALYALAIVTFMLGLSAARAAPLGGALIVTGVAVFALFVAWERRVAQPVLDIGMMLRNRVFARSNLAALIHYSATYAVSFMLSLYLQEVRGFDPSHAGLVLITQAVLMAAVSPLAGRLSDRIEPRIVASLGMGLTAAGLAALCLLDTGTPVAFVVAALAVIGTGFGLFSSPNTNAVMSAVERRDYGVASATVGTMRIMGQNMSMGIAAAILALSIGHARITPELYGAFVQAMRMVFGLCTVLCAVGVFASASRGNLRAPDPGAG